MASVNSKQGNIDGNYATFQFNPLSSAASVPIYTRMKFITGGYIDIAGITDEADVILWEPINAATVTTPPSNGIWVNTRMLNSGGTTWGLSSGTITASTDIYSAANGYVSATQSTGHRIGRSVSDGTNLNPVIYIPFGGEIASLP